MERDVINKLIAWKDSPSRKPLLLKGARQTGKTWSLKEFGRRCYDSYVYFNLDKEPAIAKIFTENKDPQRIISLLSIISKKTIIPGHTLVILDEIQECPDALNSIKYFKEEMPEYHVATAGSLLGIALKERTVPVGQADIIHMYPLTFSEFLMAVDPSLYSYYSAIRREERIDDIIHNHLSDLYSLYLIIGGMPECVDSYLRYNDLDEVDRIQQDIIELYESDFTKHSGSVNAGRILQVFRSIVSQLAKPNEKFIYGAIRRGARSVYFEEAIEWLVSAGIVNRVHNVTTPSFPLRAYKDNDAFKLFLFDTGLLKHMAGIDNSVITLRTPYQFKGPLTENYVLQQLIPQLKIEPFYYSTQSSEIDFIIQQGEIIPIEVKGGEDCGVPSFKRYIKDRCPKDAIRFSMLGYSHDGAITNMPLYLASRMASLL